MFDESSERSICDCPYSDQDRLARYADPKAQRSPQGAGPRVWPALCSHRAGKGRAMRDSQTANYTVPLKKWAPQLRQRLDNLQSENVIADYLASNVRLYVWAEESQMQYKPAVEKIVRDAGCLGTA
jgi:hypothetical protein